MADAKHTEGTMTLDGLIEGPLPERDDAEEVVRDWVQTVGQMGLRFRLELDGRSFNLMPDTHPVPTREIGDPPEQQIAEAVEQLARLVAEEADGHVFSTLRSSRYGPGEEVQTLYAVQADGSVKTEQRTVEADTAPPPAPVSPGEYVKTGLMALGVLAVLFGVSALFVDYGDLWQRFVDTVRPTNAEEIEVDATDLYDMLAVGEKEAKGGALLVEVKAGESFPTDTNLQQVWQAAEGDPRRQLAIEALLRGYVRVEYFGEKDGEEKFLYDSHVRVADLEEDEDALLKLPLPRRNRLHRVRLTY